MVNLIQLPEDVIVCVCYWLRVEDVLRLIETCRALHTLASSDYVWHQIPLDFPLATRPDKPHTSRPANELRHLAVQALRLNRNWRRPVFARPRLTRVDHGNIVFRSELLANDRLCTLSRSLTSMTYFTVWVLADSGPRREHCFETPGAINFSAALVRDSDDSLVAIIGRTSRHLEYLDVYRVSASRSVEDVDYPQVSLVASVCRPSHEGTFNEVHVADYIVAVSLARFEGQHVPVYQILLVNTRTCVHLLVNPSIPQYSDHKHFRLCGAVEPRHILFLNTSPGRTASLVTHIHALPSELFDIEPPPERESIRARSPHTPPYRPRGSPPHSTPSSPPPPASPPPRLVELGPLVHRHEIPTVPVRLQTYASDVQMDPSTGRCALAVLAFHGAYVGSRGQAGARSTVFSLPRKRSDSASADVQTFRMDPLVGLDIVCIGRSGRRAVWLERNWETDAFALVKADFGAPGDKGAGEKRQLVVAPLLPPHLALPFEAHACQSLAFDEARGRVCLALHTGDVYVLDF
ncbi:hypothetical protein BD626DRAFT_491076 [Schizophyllum amplum]|uniref:F-box domain-containing protein n=1 Tax=Schizophyllum amplum TaxID=97359 RepID=A0A550CHE0_9AGAR|nr:hypothetical protein BD626DRAFT_491076 [Auriculariopsis ampla]